MRISIAGSLAVLVALIAPVLPVMPVAAQSSTAGAIRGVVRYKDAKQRLAGVTVVATSPALQGARSTITGGDGGYVLSDLPPGTYAVRFYYADTVVSRSNVAVTVNKVTTVDAAIEPAAGEEIQIRGTSPTIDPSSTRHGVSYDYTQNMPAPRHRGRNTRGEPESSPEHYEHYEHYEHHGSNPWTRTSRDRHSTFAVDVDTASYAIARTKILAGARPPEASVRVEEWLNYFRYGYAGPSDRQPFAVHMDAAPSPYADNRTLLRVGVQARRVKPKDRKPANLVFLVDVSGSMQAVNKLGLARRALRILVANLDGRDVVSLVTYAGNTRVVLEPTRASNKGVIVSAIDELHAGGSTAMADGIKLAYKLAGRNVSDGTISRVIVLSDGDANVGATGHDAILETIAAEVERGVTLTTVGFGVGNYKDHAMEQLANKGNGNNYYIDGISEARKVFAEQLGGTLEVVAKDVKIQVELDPDLVTRYRLIGYENRDIADEDFRDDSVDAGEIGAGHTVTAMYELELARGSRAGELARVRVRSMVPRGKRAVEHSYTFDPDQHSATFSGASDDFRFAAAVMGAAEILRGNRDAGDWTLERVIRIGRDALAGHRDRAEFVNLMERLAGVERGVYRFAAARTPRGGYLSVGGGIGGLVVRDSIAPTRVTAMPSIRVGVGRGATDITLELAASRDAAEATTAKSTTPVGDALSIYSLGAVISHRLLPGAFVQPIGGVGLTTLVVSPRIGERRMALAARARLGLEVVHQTRNAAVAIGLDATGHLPVAESELMPMEVSSLISLGSYVDVRF